MPVISTGAGRLFRPAERRDPRILRCLHFSLRSTIAYFFEALLPTETVAPPRLALCAPYIQANPTISRAKKHDRANDQPNEITHPARPLSLALCRPSSVTGCFPCSRTFCRRPSIHAPYSTNAPKQIAAPTVNAISRAFMLRVVVHCCSITELQTRLGRRRVHARPRRDELRVHFFVRDHRCVVLVGTPL